MVQCFILRLQISSLTMRIKKGYHSMSICKIFPVTFLMVAFIFLFFFKFMACKKKVCRCIKTSHLGPNYSVFGQQFPSLLTDHQYRNLEKLSATLISYQIFRAPTGGRSAGNLISLG